MRHIRPSSSLFASFIVLVIKDGNMRMCIDYCVLNKKKIINKYSILRIDELYGQLIF